MNKKFPVLSTVATMMKFAGWLLVIIGVAYGGYEGIYEPNLPRHRFNPGDFIQLISGLGMGIFGLMTVALSEIIGVLFAIEKNTRTIQL